MLFRRDPVKRLEKAYQVKMKAAMLAMRKGDVRSNALLVAQANALRAEIESLTNDNSQ